MKDTALEAAVDIIKHARSLKNNLPTALAKLDSLDATDAMYF